MGGRAGGGRAAGPGRPRDAATDRRHRDARPRRPPRPTGPGPAQARGGRRPAWPALLGGGGVFGVLKYAGDGDGGEAGARADGSDERRDARGRRGHRRRTGPARPAGTGSSDPAAVSPWSSRRAGQRQTNGDQIDYTPDDGKHCIRIAVDPTPDFENPYVHLLDLEKQVQRRIGLQAASAEPEHLPRPAPAPPSGTSPGPRRRDHPGPRRAIEQMYVAPDGTEYAIYMSGPAADWDDHPAAVRHRAQRLGAARQEALIGRPHPASDHWRKWQNPVTDGYPKSSGRQYPRRHDGLAGPRTPRHPATAPHAHQPGRPRPGRRPHRRRRGHPRAGRPAHPGRGRLRPHRQPHPVHRREAGRPARVHPRGRGRGLRAGPRRPGRLGRTSPYAQRAAVLLRFHDLVLDRQAEVLDLIQLETGKARLHAHEEVQAVAVAARHYGRKAPCVPEAEAATPAPSRPSPRSPNCASRAVSSARSPPGTTRSNSPSATRCPPSSRATRS